jgi:large subunit ribosomal protein L18
MKVSKRRRNENKTDYMKRIKLLKSESPRLIFRKTNRYVLSQYITSKEAQDKIEIGISSKLLESYGWPKEFSGSLKSLPASYFTGLLIGKEILKKKLETPIIDFGMIRVISKNKAFAFLKGVADSGVIVNCPEENFPEQERIEGKNLKQDFSKVFKEIKLKIEEGKQEISPSKKKNISKK